MYPSVRLSVCLHVLVCLHARVRVSVVIRYACHAFNAFVIDICVGAYMYGYLFVFAHWCVCVCCLCVSRMYVCFILLV